MHPVSEVDVAGLRVVWEVGQVQRAGRGPFEAWYPLNRTIRVHSGAKFRLQSQVVPVFNAVQQKRTQK